MSAHGPSVSRPDLDPYGQAQPFEQARNFGSNHELDQTVVIGSSPAPTVLCPPADGGNGKQSGGNNKGGSNITPDYPPGAATKTRTVADLRAARESRANEALKMKDEQLRILQDQNNQLLGNLDRWVLQCSSSYL